MRSQRRLARAILVLLVALLAVFVLFAGGPGGPMSFAQEPTSGFSIQFLNPSGHSEEISTKPDTSGASSENAYHLVAWVNEVPPDATVEFRYDNPDAENEEITIGTGGQTAIDDTFEFFWDPPEDVPDGPITLHAVLFSGGTEVARDTEEDTTLNDQSPSPPDPTEEAQAETVEIVFPANGGNFGFYQQRDGNTLGVVQVAKSAGVTQVRTFYTTSDPGTEPNWNQCGQETRASSDDGVRCTLSPSHALEEVTAVAALANDTPPPLAFNTTFNDSGDAHRLAPYSQDPTELSIEPDIDSEVPADECSEPFIVSLEDQEGVRIAGADIDVHAVGPGDDLRFDDAHEAPEQGEHTDEEAVDCGSPPDPSGEQGERDLPDADIKHIESVSNTNDAGQFSFQLFSVTDGGTQVTAWADDDDDDEHCSDEASDDAAAGWRENAPDVTGVPPDETSCPSPTATGPTTPPTGTTTSPGPTGTEDPRGCTISGDDDANVLEGTPEDDVICGNGGNDVIRGLGGNDTIHGDDGDDDARGGEGDDLLVGGDGRDTLRGGNGSDVHRGGGESDTLVGGKGEDGLFGGGAFDTLRGGVESDNLVGAGGNDTLVAGAGNDSLRGGSGKDILRGGKGRDRCRPGPGRDQVTGCER